MHPLDYLAVFRRRWFYVAFATLVGALAGFLTAPGSSDEPELFQGTHALLVDASSPGAESVNLRQIALMVTSGAVPEKVAERLEEAGLPPVEEVEADVTLDARALDVTAYSSTPEGAATAADLFAEELNAELMAAGQAIQDRALADAQGRAASLFSQVERIDQQLAGLAEEDPARLALDDQRNALLSSLAQAQTEVQALESQGGIAAPLRTLSAAIGEPAKAAGWAIPESKPVRAAMLGAFGLLLGIGGAVGADRLDTRVRGKEDAEQAFDLPVIAEIPPLPSGAKGHELLVVSRPAAPFVEACRALRTVVLFAAGNQEQAANGNGNGAAPAAHVVLFTSPSAGEGKTTTAAHLAATLAEFGKRVLVISADFRRPRIHKIFDVEREPGLSDVLDSTDGRIRLSDLQMSTSCTGVHLLPSGRPVDNPAQLLTETAQLIAAARSLFDFIVVDTPPLLVANDATELAAVADMVILMAKADRTSRAGARRSVEILRRVDAPVLGVVVTASHDTPTAYGYYRYRYYADTDQGGRGGRKGGRSEMSAPAGAPTGAAAEG
jgi:capsular exopolysaccharide synthesis family protein